MFDYEKSKYKFDRVSKNYQNYINKVIKPRPLTHIRAKEKNNGLRFKTRLFLLSRINERYPRKPYKKKFPKPNKYDREKQSILLVCITLILIETVKDNLAQEEKRSKLSTRRQPKV